MVLSNSASRSRNATLTMNRNSGGGDKKAGFPYQIGRSYTTSIFFGAVDPVHGRCCNLSYLSKNKGPLANMSRPIGRNNNIAYWGIPGTGN